MIVYFFLSLTELLRLGGGERIDEGVTGLPPMEGSIRGLSHLWDFQGSRIDEIFIQDGGFVQAHDLWLR